MIYCTDVIESRASIPDPEMDGKGSAFFAPHFFATVRSVRHTPNITAAFQSKNITEKTLK